MKIRWSLRVNPAEKKALSRVANTCATTKITGTRAKINLASASGGGGGGTTTGNDPRFDYCYNAVAAGFGP